MQSISACGLSIITIPKPILSISLEFVSASNNIVGLVFHQLRTYQYIKLYGDLCSNGSGAFFFFFFFFCCRMSNPQIADINCESSKPHVFPPHHTLTKPPPPIIPTSSSHIHPIPISRKWCSSPHLLHPLFQPPPPSINPSIPHQTSNLYSPISYSNSFAPAIPSSWSVISVSFAMPKMYPSTLSSTPPPPKAALMSKSIKCAKIVSLKVMSMT